MYEGKQERDNPKGGASDNSSEDVVRHESPGRTGFDGGLEDHVNGMRDGTLASELTPGCGEPSHMIQCAVNDAAMIEPSAIQGTTTVVDSNEGGNEHDFVRRLMRLTYFLQRHLYVRLMLSHLQWS